MKGSAKKRRFVKLIEDTYFKVFSKDDGEGEIHLAEFTKHINKLIDDNGFIKQSGDITRTSPDGTIFKIIVGNDGTLSTEEVNE